MRIFGLVGFPLGHSFSKRYFDDFFAANELSDCRFENFEWESVDQIRSRVASMPELVGFNVTIPHKKNIISQLDWVDESALAAGAVNCVKVSRCAEGVFLRGYNTDTYGFRKAVTAMTDIRGLKALVLGSGGAAGAVCSVFDQMNVPYRVVSRSKSEKTMVYSDLSQEIMQEYRLIVNTTPQGMFPHTDEAPEIPYQWITQNHFLYDLVYNPSETLFLKKGRTVGATVKNGQTMLIEQARRAWAIYNDQE